MDKFFETIDGNLTRISTSIVNEFSGFEKLRLKAEVVDVKTQLKFGFNPDGTIKNNRYDFIGSVFDLKFTALAVLETNLYLGPNTFKLEKGLNSYETSGGLVYNDGIIDPDDIKLYNVNGRIILESLVGNVADSLGNNNIYLNATDDIKMISSSSVVSSAGDGINTSYLYVNPADVSIVSDALLVYATDVAILSNTFLYNGNQVLTSLPTDKFDLNFTEMIIHPNKYLPQNKPKSITVNPDGILYYKFAVSGSLITVFITMSYKNLLSAMGTTWDASAVNTLSYINSIEIISNTNNTGEPMSSNGYCLCDNGMVINKTNGLAITTGINAASTANSTKLTFIIKAFATNEDDRFYANQSTSSITGFIVGDTAVPTFFPVNYTIPLIVGYTQP